jgi:hypothetical protein
MVFETSVNPNGSDAGMQFMCRRTAHPRDAMFSCGGLGIGSGTTPVVVRQRTSGLGPGTEYVVFAQADNSNGATQSRAATRAWVRNG